MKLHSKASDSKASQRIKGLCVTSPITLVVLLMAGCTLHLIDTSHYLGPVFFRKTAPPISNAYIDQINKYGLALDAGLNWGITLGLSENITVNPLLHNKIAIANNRISKPILAFQLPNDWQFSLIYLCVDHNETDYFEYHSVSGAEFNIGLNKNNLSIGSITTTKLNIPNNSFATLDFQIDKPMRTRAHLWLDDLPNRSIPSELLEELK